MTGAARVLALYAVMAALILLVGLLQSWTVALAILQLSLISAIMSLGANIQWGYAGLFNAGVMGFAALGGVAGVLVAMPPVAGALAAGGLDLGLAILTVLATAALILFLRPRLPDLIRTPATLVLAFLGYLAMRRFLDPASAAIGSATGAQGYMGGLGLPILIAWPVGGLFAAGAAWLVGKVALGLRSDYLAIATLGIAEIILAVLKNENWLTRGVKNVTGIPRPVPDEIVLQQQPWVIDLAARFGSDPVMTAAVVSRLWYAVLFAIVLAILLWLSERALRSPWGRMMRAIRDNRDAAEAMGKDVTRRHLRVFVLGSAVVGIAGAMLVTLDGQFTPASYNPLRYTFLIWVMVIVGGSGNNWGAVLGGFLIWYVWVVAEPIGNWLTAHLAALASPGGWWDSHLRAAAPHFRPLLMGLILLVTLRFAPRGLIPEARGR
ncbi:branched-chain amino acid ABC transporter permease [Amaricoccus solimangrovi]|uniref:Branched-chain amino acid ABC transporter permease n=1 Tax=Amaricoccus solimangrovi TaxID=2589815 RepID=A0A501WV25_9RHOB|nr:branched-chain amino acid ABC transporter permease [Amaricoccus solimangrovi]TPE50801.1 branched-chain amino acid ABC transporter permease [Amaricoccus solimangrovi]